MPGTSLHNSRFYYKIIFKIKQRAVVNANRQWEQSGKSLCTFTQGLYLNTVLSYLYLIICSSCYFILNVREKICGSNCAKFVLARQLLLLVSFQIHHLHIAKGVIWLFYKTFRNHMTELFVSTRWLTNPLFSLYLSEGLQKLLQIIFTPPLKAVQMYLPAHSYYVIIRCQANNDHSEATLSKIV